MLVIPLNPSMELTMLSDQEFEDWGHHFGLLKAARDIIARIRTSEPVRKVGGSRNVCGSYPSHKMQRTIQFESHKVELPAIVEYENDEDVLEYYDQPYQFTLSFSSKNGRAVVCRHIPDFLVIRRSATSFEEWKPEQRLEKLAVQQPNRYFRAVDGQWHSPPAESYAQTLGIAYRLRTDHEINWTQYRNYQFLKHYLEKPYPVQEKVSTTILTAVANNPGISLTELRQLLPSVNVDYINTLIATKHLYVDLRAVALSEPERVHIFRNQQTADAYSLATPRQTCSSIESLQFLNLTPGATLNWDGKMLSIVQIGKTKVTLQGKQGLIELTHADFNQLVQRGEITWLDTHPARVKDIPAWQPFLKASPEDLNAATYRYRVIEPYLAGQTPETSTVSKRTIRSWKSKFLAAQEHYGWGYLGLLPHRAAKGNRISKISDSAWEFIDQIIETHFETLKQRGKLAVYGILVHEWEKVGRVEPCPSHTTFYSRVKQRSGYRQTQQRQGNRAAYQRAPFYYELSFTTPRHGDRPFEICHIDHTLLDIELVCVRTGRSLGRPWATLLIDAFSRRILAAYFTFDPPSYRSCMMGLRICMQRFERFPETVVVDNAKEFNSIYFETLLAAFRCTKKQRPPASPRFGSVIERLFGTTHTEFFYNLRGNTQITKQVRQVTKANHPKGQAVWSLAELYQHFCGYAYEFYDQKDHPALGQSPRDVFLAGLVQSGNRAQQQINDETFRIFTLPSTSKGTAKVQPRVGIKVNHFHYWSIDDSFLKPEVEGTQVPVRYDPFDVGTAYAYVCGHWVRCISEHYQLLQGHSEREIKLASTEIRKQKHQHAQRIAVRAKEIASYLERAEISETLQSQHLYDLAAGDIHSLLHDKTTSPHEGQFCNSFESPTDDDNHQGYKPPAKTHIDLAHLHPYSREELW